MNFGSSQSEGSMVPPAMEENEDIVAGIARGDREAERALVSRYMRPIRALLLARTRNPDLAADLAQDVMVEALCALRRDNLRDTAKLGAFLSGIARNVAKSHFRSVVRRPAHVALPENLPDLHVAPDFAEERDQSNRAMAAIQTLDAVDRSILQMTLVDGLKPGAIARHLALSSDVVRQRKIRATRRVTEIVRGLSQKLSSSDIESRRNR
jgi:RNA polymerase sigma factor (sigma-70 family)